MQGFCYTTGCRHAALIAHFEPGGVLPAGPCKCASTSIKLILSSLPARVTRLEKDTHAVHVGAAATTARGGRQARTPSATWERRRGCCWRPLRRCAGTMAPQSRWPSYGAHAARTCRPGCWRRQRPMACACMARLCLSSSGCRLARGRKSSWSSSRAPWSMMSSAPPASPEPVKLV